MSYRPKIKVTSSGTLTDLALDAETLAGHSVEETGVASNTTTLPTTAQVKSFVEGKGYLTSHQSIKTLNTNNTTAQTASSSEAIKGSGTINLHKVSKTGSYNDLLDKPTIPTNTNQTVKGNGTAFGANAAVNIVGGTNVTVTADTTNSKITIAASAPVADATTTTKGIAMLVTGDMNGATHTDGVAVSKNHTHSQYLSRSGGTMTGGIYMQGVDLNLKTGGSSSNDSGDITFWYGNDGEKCRIYTDDTYTSSTKHKGPNYRVFDTNGNQLNSAQLLLSDKGEIIDSLGLGEAFSSSDWGTVTSGNGFNQLLVTAQPNGGGIVFGEKNGQTSIQIDGDFYGQEGRKKVAYENDITFKFKEQIGDNTYDIDLNVESTGAYMAWKAYGDAAISIDYCSGWDNEEQEYEWTAIATIWTGVIMVHFVPWGVYVTAISSDTSRNNYSALNPNNFYVKKIRFNIGSSRAFIMKLPA